VPAEGQPAGAEPGNVRVPGSGIRGDGRKSRICPHQRDPVPHRGRLPAIQLCGQDGNPQGFNIDLARLLCEELKLPCTIQMRRFETLIPALNANQGDAAIASIAATPDLRAKVDFTDSYYRTPARFVAKRDSPIQDPLPERLEGKKVAVVAGTAHEAYLKALFTEVEVRPYPNADASRAALRRGEVDLLFGDAISLAFWLNGTDSGELLRL
jgi:polar amino acid transport system substrate-binding protein